MLLFPALLLSVLTLAVRGALGDKCLDDYNSCLNPCPHTPGFINNCEWACGRIYTSCVGIN
ncbi:unnamed protein product [Cercospora beticola]|nr:unnamed protein product [Cercospora beticola]